MFSNNTVYFFPTDNLWILAVANSPISWWYSWRSAVHGKDEALRFIGEYVPDMPIPRPTDEQRDSAETVVRRLIESAKAQQSGRQDVLDWLRVEFAVEKATQKLQDAAGLDSAALVDEVKKARGKKKPLTVADLKRLREEHGRSILPLQALAAEARTLERQVSELVNAAYGLTSEDVALMWRTAPPRMPGEPPGRSPGDLP